MKWLIHANSIQNYSLPIRKKIQIILSKILITFTIYGFTHFNSSIDYFHTLNLLKLLFIYF
jgi:hypothetical protein